MLKLFTFFILYAVSFSSVAHAQWIPLNGPGEADIFSMTNLGTALFAGSTGNGVYRSTNNGAGWASLSKGLPANACIQSLMTHGTTIYAGTGDWFLEQGFGLYYSMDNGETWKVSDSGLPVPVVITALLESGNNLFAGTDQNGIYLSTNNGSDWATANSGLPDSAYISAVMAHQNSLFAAGDFQNGMYRSTNNGQSWSPVNTGLPQNTSVTSLVKTGTTIFAGTYFDGVYRFTNNGESWSAVNTGFPDSVFIWTLRADSANLYAGVYAKGVWRIPLSSIAINSNPDGLKENRFFSISLVNRQKSLLVIRFSIAYPEPVTITVYNLSGRSLATPAERIFGPGDHTVTFDTRALVSGCYFVKLGIGSRTVVKRFSLVR